MHEEPSAAAETQPVKTRIVLHFPGFEPLDAQQHHARYARTAQKTATVWNIRIDPGPLGPAETGRCFTVASEGAAWRTSSRFFICDHNTIVQGLNNRPLFKRLLGGYLSAARVVLEGGALAYLLQAWRFGLFFLFPFLLVALALAAGLAIAGFPHWTGLPAWSYALSLALAYGFFFRLFLPWSDRLHTLHLFSDWELAVAVARLDRPELDRWLEDCAATVRVALREPADEYVVSSHSMGASLAVQVVGKLLEREPTLFEGKRIVFVTLGGAILQCTLLRSAEALRARVGAIAAATSITWLDVQCLKDIVNFYGTRVAAASGHPDAPQPRRVAIRMRHMLAPERYRKIKNDVLRVHRQYVLDADKRAPFDFTLLTVGPLPAASFADFTSGRLPEV